MQNLVLSPIDTDILIKSIVDKVTANILEAVGGKQVNTEADKFLTVHEAAQFLNLSIPTIYSKVSRRELPVMKQGKKLHFSKAELLEYLKSGRKKTFAEIEAEANVYFSNKNKRLNNGI